jgi:hypothetical protein
MEGGIREFWVQGSEFRVEKVYAVFSILYVSTGYSVFPYLRYTAKTKATHVKNVPNELITEYPRLVPYW